jgi:uncharacterized caspase-like protein
MGDKWRSDENYGRGNDVHFIIEGNVRGTRMKARIAIILLSVMLLPSAATAEKRVALLIGNQNYASAVGSLQNPHNDVTRLGAALNRLGFEVMMIKDATFGQLNRAINAYIRKLNADSSGSIGFFYYSGHGAQQEKTGTNYLVPVDVRSVDSQELWDGSIRLKSVTDALKDQAPNATHFVVFDACRNSLRLVEPSSKALVQAKGFEPIRMIPRGMLIAYATAEGEVASDAGQGVGPYARILAEEIVKPDVEAVTMFRNVQLRVSDAVRQEPWLSYGTLSPVWFAGRTGTQPITPPIPVPVTRSQAAEEWDAAKSTTTIAVLEAFIARYGNTTYADLARARVEELKKQKVTLVSPALPVANCPNIVGTWNSWASGMWGKGDATFYKDGTATHRSFFFNGKWFCKSGQLRIEWADGKPGAVTVSPDGKKIFNSEGSVHMSRD